MYQKRIISLFVASLFFLVLVFTNSVIADDKDKATKLIKKVKAAATYLSKAPKSRLKDFNLKKSKWVSKDLYLFVFKCSDGSIIAHPIKPQLVGKKLFGLKDIKGNLFFVQMCEEAEKPKGGWTEYWWPKPGEKTPSRKLSLLVPVPGTELQIGAGIYSDNLTIEELNNLL